MAWPVGLSFEYMVVTKRVGTSNVEISDHQGCLGRVVVACRVERSLVHRRIWVIGGFAQSRQRRGWRGAEAIMKDRGIVWCSAVICWL